MFLMIGIGSMLLLQSVSGGRAALGAQDRTGSPIANGTCSACHLGGSFSATSSAVITNSAGATVTSYIPGQTYTVTYTVTGTGASGYAMQAAFLNSSNNNAGDFLASTTSNTQLTTINGSGVEYLEHRGTQATGVFSATWKAPAAGTGTVTLYGIGLAVNGNGGTSGDQASPTIQVALTEDNNTSVNNIEEEVALFEIYPMPNRGNFMVKNNAKENAMTLEVINMIGKVVAVKQLNLAHNTSETMNFPNLIPGIYTVILKGETLHQTQQIIIVK